MLSLELALRTETELIPQQLQNYKQTNVKQTRITK